MDSKRQSHVTLCSLRHDGQRYLCHGRQQSQETGSLDLFVTNGIDVWKADVTKEAQEQWNTASTLSNSSDGLESLREVLGRTPPLLDVQGSLVTLTLQLISGNVILDLFKLPISETRMHLQTLVFSLADQLTDMEKLQRGKGLVRVCQNWELWRKDEGTGESSNFVWAILTCSLPVFHYHK
ncbi:PAXX isoform X1 [Pelobates cultripes]|uniref:PAXX isoform X1 n=1 Tax=Pelobates cultripes TaxID=61616 RepID=A0AAD1T8B1_PELCU|nr:PAXX isoform X1 [Pelobates cultripes]